MSGPFAETASVYTRTLADASYWPLKRCAAGGQVHIECGECEDDLVPADELLMLADLADLADLAAKVEEHITRCPGARDRS